MPNGQFYSLFSSQSGYVHKLKKAWIKEYTNKDDADQDSNSTTVPDNANPDPGNDPAPPGSPSASSQLSSSPSSLTALHKFKKLNAFRISSNKVRTVHSALRSPHCPI